MIYTSYFAKLKSLPDNIIPISICAKAPDWYKGLEYKKLAPTYDLLMHWKKNHDEEYYRKCFMEQVTDRLNQKSVVEELDSLLITSVSGIDCKIDSMMIPHIALVCYEKSSDFCHRHLVADWLRDNGYKCEEWENK